jgi:predicted alpha-1,6-mannanase (GH76 family)
MKLAQCCSCVALSVVVMSNLLACGSVEGDPEEAESSVADISAANDKRDPALAQSERVPATATVWNRNIALHISDKDNAAWASIDNGDPGDEGWIDRSWNGGASWNDGSRLGVTKIPNGNRGWRTLMFGIDNTDKQAIGAVRACGKAKNRGEVACTPWFRSTVNADNPLNAAATALMQFYDSGALWSDMWWNSANALTALIDYSQATGSTTYRYAIGETFDKNKRHNFFETDFTNEFMDDTGWWGLAWARAYDLTGEQRYLDMAKKDADYVWSFHDTTCGGGVWWKKDKRYKNAITNELYIKLAAAIHNRVPGDTAYLAKAQETWRWFKASGMINGSHLINDGLDNCVNNGQPTWTYNQGVILGGLVELHIATGDASYLTEAKALADASTTTPDLVVSGVLREPCESSADACGKDGPSFKGAYMRNLGELNRALPGRPYQAFLERQAEALEANHTTLNQYGVKWVGGVDRVDGARQHSALDALTAAH